MMTAEPEEISDKEKTGLSAAAVPSIVLSSWDPMHHIVSLMSQRMRRFMTLGYCIVMRLLRSRGLMGKHI